MHAAMCVSTSNIRIGLVVWLDANCRSDATEILTRFICSEHAVVDDLPQIY